MTIYNSQILVLTNLWVEKDHYRTTASQMLPHGESFSEQQWCGSVCCFGVFVYHVSHCCVEKQFTNQKYSANSNSVITDDKFYIGEKKKMRNNL